MWGLPGVVAVDIQLLWISRLLQPTAKEAQGVDEVVDGAAPCPRLGGRCRCEVAPSPDWGAGAGVPPP